LTLSPASIRAAIITVPQESFFLPSGCSFRANMDPLGQATREDCEGVLAALGLEELVRERGGLDGEMKGLSAGQSQVLGLARAVLRARVRRMAAKEGSSVESDVGGVLLLDEVSSKVDADTDALMQKVVREEFKGYTIVAVTHRLKTVSDFDRLIVMDYGSIKSNGELSDGLQTMV
jgi:ABC-type transport system involved in cytochrome bd biosynthesis fused ATPase/permease subunit